MHTSAGTWSLVLAAGDGSRLRSLTTHPCGTAVPKQFCSLHGGQSLLEDAFDRAAALTDHDRIATIVAFQHRQWWSGIERVNRLPPSNVIVQPANRGTAIGVLFALLHILHRDPRAHVVLLPADHYVRDEDTLHESLRLAIERTQRDPARAVLLGLEPEEIDTELGYVVPSAKDPLGGYLVAQFVEKPDYSNAASIIAAGGLWNSFIVAASAQALLDLFMPRYAQLVMEMQLIVSRGLASGSPTAAWPAIVDLYERLPTLDFSRDLLEGRESKLCVMCTPACGWSDLGTPHRVGETLRRLGPVKVVRETSRAPYINLAAQHARLQEARTG